MTRTALIVEDEALIAMALEDMLIELGVQVCGMAATSEDAVRLAVRHTPHLVLMDVRLKDGGDGVSTAHAIHAHGVMTRIIFVTGSREPATVARVQAGHPAQLLFKPVQPSELAAAVRSATP